MKTGNQNIKLEQVVPIDFEFLFALPKAPKNNREDHFRESFPFSLEQVPLQKWQL